MRLVHSACSARNVLGLVPCVVLFALAEPAHAQDQAVLLDLTYTATAANTDDSHYRVDPDDGAPTNWRSPVDYASGRVHARLEVLTKPSDAPTLYNICFEGTPSYACMPYSPEYTEPGVYDFEYNFSGFYQYDQVDWTQGTSRIALILKDENGEKQQGSADYYPTQVHITLTLLAPGATYVPPSEEPDAGEPMEEDASVPVMQDAGSDLLPDAGVTPADAGRPMTQADASQPMAMPTAGTSAEPMPATGGMGAELPPVAGEAMPPRPAAVDATQDTGCSVSVPSPRSAHVGVLSVWLALAITSRRRRRSPRRRAATSSRSAS